jgi:2-keto-4-pentenoate hydratase/2-oxohepta-3-ene-1,7-dioic acid hydratase in catechol pathway
VRIARIAHTRGMSFAVVDGEGSGTTVSEIAGHPFGDIELSGQRWALDDVRLMSPILPSKIVCVGRNYAAHAAEQGAEVPAQPLLFLKPSTTVIGPGDAIRLPAQSQRVEHEAELAVVIGAPGARRVTDLAQAEQAIFGYTCANDVTARDLQNTDNQWTRAKGFDSFCPLGPWIETDIDVSDVEVRCEVNDSVRQLGRTKDMTFSPAAVVSYVSHIMTLLPGDVILTGTPEGIEPIVAGDSVSVSIENIGTLTNSVVSLDF